MFGLEYEGKYTPSGILEKKLLYLFYKLAQ